MHRAICTMGMLKFRNMCCTNRITHVLEVTACTASGRQVGQKLLCFPVYSLGITSLSSNCQRSHGSDWLSRLNCLAYCISTPAGFTSLQQLGAKRRNKTSGRHSRISLKAHAQHKMLCSDRLGNTEPRQNLGKTPNLICMHRFKVQVSATTQWTGLGCQPHQFVDLACLVPKK